MISNKGINDYRVESYESVDSTNTLALEYAKSGDTGRLWIVAKEQYAGRGRSGRQWISRSGNLYASLLLVDEVPTEKAALLGFVAGVSLVEAIEDLSHDHNLQTLSAKLKWPNDVLINDAKASGILLEMTRLSSGSNALVIGIGVNVAYCPTDLAYVTSSLHSAGLTVRVEDVFHKLCQKWADNFALWQQTNGHQLIREKWLSYAAHLNKEISTVHNGVLCSGIFETLDNDFRCIIKKENNEKVAITAGDIYFGSIAGFVNEQTHKSE